MEIKELYYINEQGAQVGPVPFDKIKRVPIGPQTYVWFEGIGDGWRRAAEVEEIKRQFVAPKKTPTPPPFPGAAPKPTYEPEAEATVATPPSGPFAPGQNVMTPEPKKPEPPVNQPDQHIIIPQPEKKTGNLSSKDRKTRKLVIILSLVIGFIGSLILIFLNPIIASIFDAQPLIIGVIEGVLLLGACILIGALFKKKMVMGPMLGIGLLLGATQPLVSYARFGDNGRYNHGFLQSNGVYNSLGFKVLPYRYLGGNYPLATSSYGEYMMLDIRYYNQEIHVTGYDDSGSIVFSDTVPCYGYETDENGNLTYGSKEEIARDLASYLTNEHNVTVINGPLFSSQIDFGSI